MPTDTDLESIVVVNADRMEQFVVDVFVRLGLTEANARDAAEVLIAADIYGVEPHGVPRLSNYVNRLKNEAIKANPDVRVVHELPSTALVDGDTGLGMVVGRVLWRLPLQRHRTPAPVLYRCVTAPTTASPASMPGWPWTTT